MVFLVSHGFPMVFQWFPTTLQNFCKVATGEHALADDDTLDHGASSSRRWASLGGIVGSPCVYQMACAEIILIAYIYIYVYIYIHTEKGKL